MLTEPFEISSTTDYFQSSWNISTWCNSSPVWSRFTCWRSLGLLQSLYWWCLFPNKFPILVKISSFRYNSCSSQMLVPIVQAMLNVLDSWRDLMCPYWWVYITLCLLSIHLYNDWDLHEWISTTGHWRWGIHKRKCCSMLGSWNWSSSRYRASKWYINLASLRMLNCVMFYWNLSSFMSWV